MGMEYNLKSHHDGSIRENAVDQDVREGGELLHHRRTGESALTSKVVGTNRPAAMGPIRLWEKVRKLLHRHTPEGAF